MRGLTLFAASIIITAPVPTATAAFQEPKVGQTKPAEDPNKVVCRRETETGSRARIRKTCMTRAEWTKMWDTTRDANNALQAQGAGRIGCINAGATGTC